MRITGIEITEEGMAAVTLERQGTGLRVVAFDRVRRSEECFDDDALLAALAEKLPLRGEKVSLVLAPGSVKTRSMRFGFSDARSITRALPGALEESLATTLSGLDFTWQKRPLSARDGSTDVLAFITKTAEQEGLKRVFKLAGIELREIIPASSPASCVPTRMVQGRFVSVSMREKEASFLLVEDGRPIVTRTFHFNEESRDRVLSLEIWQTLASVAEEEGQFKLPGKILVSGPMPEFSTLKTPCGEIPVEPVRMLSATGAVVAENLKNHWEEGPFDNALAAAAAMLSGWRHMSIWEQGFVLVELIAKHKKQVMVTAALLLVTLLVFGVRTGVSIRDTSTQLAAVEQEMKTLYLNSFPDVTQAPAADVMVRSMEGQLRVARKGADYAGGRAKRVKILDLLQAISTSIPSDLNLELKRLALTRGKLSVTGLADDIAIIDTMKRALEKNPMISDVTIASSSKETGGERFQFKVIIVPAGGEAS